MKIYIQKTEEKSITEISLYDLFEHMLEGSVSLKKNTKIEADSFNDKSGKWIEIKEKQKKKIISLVLMFNDEGDKLTDLSVFKTPIKTIIDEENTKQII